MDCVLLLILIRDSQGRLLSKQTPPLISHPSRALIVLKNPWHSAEAVLNLFNYLYRSNGKALRRLVFGLEWPDHWLYCLCFFQQVRNTEMGMYFNPSCSFGGYGCISMQPNKGKSGPLGGFFFVEDVRYLWWWIKTGFLPGRWFEALEHEAGWPQYNLLRSLLRATGEVMFWTCSAFPWVLGGQGATRTNNRALSAVWPVGSLGIWTRHANSLLSFRVMEFSFRIAVPDFTSTFRDARSLWLSWTWVSSSG